MSRIPKYDHRSDDIEINAGRASVTLSVSNNGDRAVQIGSHFHFFEVNKALRFDREQAYGMHLDVPAGTGIRFEPGDTKEVTLVAFGGLRHIVGFNGLVDGGLDSGATRLKALDRMRQLEYADGAPEPRTRTSRTRKTNAAKSAAKGTK